jgi:aspartyl-tRNA(Asn)/glutamyl-tRNA(Gln) amidotransferase subunit A
MMGVNAKGGFAPTEAFFIHRERLKSNGAGVDPFIRVRIERGGTVLAHEYVDMAQARARLMQAMDARMAPFDALVLPTTPIVAPTIAEVASSDEFGRKNAMLLRNTNPVNFFDLCAISLPLPRTNGLAAGLMLVGRNGHDRRLFNIAAAVENCLKA